MKRQLISTLLAVFFLSGCAKTIYVDRPVKVKVPVPCTITDPDCPHLSDLNDSAAVDELGRCVLQYKQNVKDCQ
jgi:hypothetical protein